MISRNEATKRFTANVAARSSELGLSQSDIARAIFGGAEAPSRMRVSRWFNGIVSPEPDELLNLAEVLECTVDDLLSKDSRPSRATRKRA